MLAVASRLKYRRAFLTGPRDLEVSGQNGGFRKQRFQHRGSVLYFRLALRSSYARINVPRTSTQFISISSLSSSAESGRSSSRVLSTNGLVSGVGRFLFLATCASCDSFSSIAARSSAHEGNMERSNRFILECCATCLRRHHRPQEAVWRLESSSWINCCSSRKRLQERTLVDTSAHGLMGSLMHSLNCTSKHYTTHFFNHKSIIKVSANIYLAGVHTFNLFDAILIQVTIQWQTAEQNPRPKRSQECQASQQPTMKLPMMETTSSRRPFRHGGVSTHA